MSLVSGFEQRLERAVEGFFARVFRSGVHPVEIGKRLIRVMEDGKTVALRRTYVPNVYRIVMSSPDFARLESIEPQLVEELEAFIGEAARQRDWVLSDAPRVSFVTESKLSRGEFRVQAEPVSLRDTRRRVRGARKPPAKRPAEPPRPTEEALIVLGDDGPTKTVKIDGKVRIGRQSDNDLVIPDRTVSRHHAEVVSDGGRCIIRDLGSANGTKVNGSEVDETELRDGDRIALGHSVLEFRRS